DSSSGAFTRILEEGSYPFVADVTGFRFQDSTLEGRLLRVFTSGGGTPILQDKGNDGEFEFVHQISYTDAETAFPDWSITSH
ncbi:MAG: hypothetical protein KDC14_18915, partial [Planctomycetes bacterium]|nr:hypothetical protein [Planctomycetota bacterium]